MDSQKTNIPTILQKIANAPQGAIAPESGHTVKLRTWVDSQDKSVTGTYLLGNKQLNPDIQSIVLQMKTGDIWKTKHFNKITQKQQIVNLELISTSKIEAQTNNTSLNGRVQLQKKIGNQFIKQKKYDQAIKSYKKCYQLIQYNCDKEAVEIRLSVVSNLALATLNTNKFSQCLEWCEKYLNQSIQVNKKILYRQISALKGLKQWQKAKQKLERALNLYQDDKQAVADFNNLRQTIEKEQKIEIQKQKKLYTNMFG